MIRNIINLSDLNIMPSKRWQRFNKEAWLEETYSGQTGHAFPSDIQIWA